MRETTVIIVTLATMIASCSGPSTLDSSDSGRTRTFEAGVPNFDMETIVRARDGAASLEAHFSIPLSSLVFVRSGEAFEAAYDVLIEVVERTSKDRVFETTASDTIRVAHYDSTLLPAPQVRMRPLDVPAGSYVVEVTITDQETGASAIRRQAVTVPGRHDSEPYVGHVHLEALRDAGGFEPLVSLHLPAMMDSLRASVQLLNLDATENLTVALRLVRFESDTSIAPPPYWLAPTRASLASRGIFYDKADTIQVTRRTITAPEENAVVEFSLPKLSPGMYRLTVEGTHADGERIAERERMISVKNSTYPQMAALYDLIEALAYIAFDDEIEFIESAENPVEAKRRFDAFWGTRVSNRNVASNLIKLYYGRVEEANLLFTGYKEGWKTDRGMVYVILGPPLYVDRRVESETWFYSYGDRDPANAYLFEKVRAFSENGFENYVLQRRPYYQHEWTRAVDLWRRGEVL